MGNEDKAVLRPVDFLSSTVGQSGQKPQKFPLYTAVRENPSVILAGMATHLCLSQTTVTSGSS